MPRKSTRRDFLAGRGTGREAPPRPEGRAAPAGPPGAAYLVHVSRRAMACDFQVFLNAGQYARGTQAALAALDLLEGLEEQMSVFRPESGLSRVNREAAKGPVEVEPRLFALLELAAQVHAQTDGAFDVTAGPLWEAWGFARRQARVPGAEELAAAQSRVGWNHVHLDPGARTVRFDAPGVQLNLGSIGKGFAADRCGESLAMAGIGDFLVHGGQSSVLARGRRLDAPPHEGWSVGVRHPLRPDRRLGMVQLRDRALGTSGSGVQFFRHKGRRLGHILDPRTGQPAEGVLSVTVLAPTAAEADALATGLYVLGPERGQEFCRRRPDVAAIYVLPARRAGGLEVVATGLSEEEWRGG